MTTSEFIQELLSELSYRSDEGYPILSKKEHISLLSEILTEWGFAGIKNEIIYNLTEAGEKRFKNPILNKVVKYKDNQGKEKEGLVGNLLRNPEDSPGRIAAEKLLPAEGTKQRDAINNELGGEGQPNRDIEKEKGGGEQQQIQEPEQNVKGSAAFSHAPDVKAAQKSDTEKTSGSETQQKTEENRKVDSEKVEKQIRMTKKEAAKSQKGVGMGKRMKALSYDPKKIFFNLSIYLILSLILFLILYYLKPKYILNKEKKIDWKKFQLYYLSINLFLVSTSAIVTLYI